MEKSFQDPANPLDLDLKWIISTLKSRLRIFPICPPLHLNGTAIVHERDTPSSTEVTPLYRNCGVPARSKTICGRCLAFSSVVLPAEQRPVLSTFRVPVPSLSWQMIVFPQKIPMVIWCVRSIYKHHPLAHKMAFCRTVLPAHRGFVKRRG